MLSINTNLSSLITQRSMHQSTNKLNQSIERMTTGAKINHAKDNAANYNIVTNMTTKLGALQVAEDNAAMGLDMLTTAEDSINQITDGLSRLRTLAVQAQNGTYGSQSLESINSEANVLTSELNRIFKTASYNGKNLLDSYNKELPEEAGLTDNLTPKYNGFIQNPIEYTQEEINNMIPVMGETSFVANEKYSISSAEELKHFADLVNSGADTTNVTFVLANDIDLEPFLQGNNWIRINTFNGVFNGNGHKISNVIMNGSLSHGNGFFCDINTDGIVKNLGLEVSFNHTSYTMVVGGLAGSSKGEIYNCYTEGEIKSTSQQIGGMVGALAGNIDYCYSTVNVSSSRESIGGLVGMGNSGSSITNCFTTGDVTGTQVYIGGLLGGGSTNLTNCYSTGNVKGNGNKVGGLAGWASHITNCYATGDVNATGDQIGGLVGYAPNGVKYSYATGNVISSGDYVGGLIGYYTTADGVISSYSTGNVQGNSFVGGLIGICDYRGAVSTSITKSYSYGEISGNNTLGSFIGGITNSSNGTNFSKIYISDCKTSSQNLPSIGMNHIYNGTTFTPLDNYDMSSWLAGISSIYIPPEETTLQIGTNSGASSSITLKTTVEYGLLDSLSGLRMEDASSLATIDSLLEKFSAKSMELGAVQNRLNSALDEISTQYENLVSSRSTLQDADIAEVSSEYIRQQILQQASATLMSTANQSASIALSLI